MFQLFEEVVHRAVGKQGMALLRVVAPANFKLLQEANQTGRAKLAAQRLQSSATPKVLSLGHAATPKVLHRVAGC